MRQDAPVSTTIYTNAKVFTADAGRPWSPSFAVKDGRVLVVGCDEEVEGTVDTGDLERADLGGALVIPGIVDAHFHLMHTGGSLQRVDLVRATSLDEIQQAVRDHARSHLKSHWVLGKSWLFDAVPGEPTAAMLDAVVPDRPVSLDANDYHSTWVNTVALEALGITSFRQLAELSPAEIHKINEAIELARTFSGDEAVPFVNGVLDAVRKKLSAG